MRRKVTKPNRKIYLRRHFNLLKTAGSLILITGVVFVLYSFFLKSTYFNISRVNITGTKNFVNKNDIQIIINSIALRTNIFLLNTQAINELLHKNFQGAREFVITKFLPTTLEVRVTERVPLALVYNSSTPNYFMIDDEGYILGVVDKNQTNLSQIKYEGDIKVGDFINKNLVPAYLEIVSALDKEKLNATSMSFYPKYARIYLIDATEIFIGNDKNKTQAIVVAGQIKNQVELEKKKVNKIDLRYDKVIVSYD